MTVVTCRACGKPLPPAALQWENGTELCDTRCAERVGVTYRILHILHEREERAAAKPEPQR